MTSPVWSSGRFWLLGAGNRPVSPLRPLAPSHSGVCAVRVGVPPCFLAHCGALWLMALRSGHCRLPAGLASMDGPLLVSSVESQLCECPFVVLLCQLVGSGVCSPASPICHTSSILKRSSFGFCVKSSRWSHPSGSSLSQSSIGTKTLCAPSLVVGAKPSRWGHPFQVEPVSVLDWNEGSSSTFLVFGWSLRDGVTLSGRFCLRSRSERRLFTHLP